MIQQSVERQSDCQNVRLGRTCSEMNSLLVLITTGRVHRLGTIAYIYIYIVALPLNTPIIYIYI